MKRTVYYASVKGIQGKVGLWENTKQGIKVALFCSAEEQRGGQPY